MKIQPPEQRRSRADIIADLEDLCQKDGFIYTYCYLIFEHLGVWIDELADIKDMSELLNSQELSFLLGLMVKCPLNFATPPSSENVKKGANRAVDLLGELHGTFVVPVQQMPNSQFESRSTPDASNVALREWLGSGDHIVEAIFYGGDGAYDFQFLELAQKRYLGDSTWLGSFLGASFGSILDIVIQLKQLIQSRFIEFGSPNSVEAICQQALEALTFTPQDVTEKQNGSVDGFLKAFACIPGRVNQDFDSVGTYNVVLSHPVIHLGGDDYFLPNLFNLAQSLYESPFYWMLNDPAYEDTAFKNRGDATEEIASEMLKGVFGEKNVHRSVVVRKGKSDLSEIDVLAVAGNKAVIVQAKSKKLTQLSKWGDTKSLKQDFQEAIQDAYEQGLVCRTAVIEKKATLESVGGKRILLDKSIDDAFILCLTGDFYPAVITQIDAYLQRNETDPYPPSMSLFDLDILTFYLKDPFEFLYYLRQRSSHAEHFKTSSEMSFLGYHLSNKLFPNDAVDLEFIPDSYAQLVDANYPVAKGYHPRTEGADRLFHNWRNEVFDQLVEALKSAEEPGYTEAILFLFDLAGAAADSITEGIQNAKSATLRDKSVHSVSYPVGKKQGISFVSYPYMVETLGEQFQFYSRASQYKHQADEWLVFGSIAGSTKIVDMICYSREKWQYNPEMENAAQLGLRHGTAVKGDRRKIGRNERCYCGSGLKFKKCHGRS